METQHDDHCMAYANYLWDEMFNDENDGIDGDGEMYIYDVK